MTEDFQGNETTPYNTIMVDECHFDVGFSSVQSLSHVRLFVNQQTAAHQASLSFTISQSLLKLVSIESVMPFNRNQLKSVVYLRGQS